MGCFMSAITTLLALALATVLAFIVTIFLQPQHAVLLFFGLAAAAAFGGVLALAAGVVAAVAGIWLWQRRRQRASASAR